MVTHAFIVFGSKLPTVTIVAVEGKHPWRKTVLPTLKQGVEKLVGEKVTWSNIYIDGISIRNDDNTAWLDPIRFFHDEHAKKKFPRIVIHGRNQFTVYHPQEG